MGVVLARGLLVAGMADSVWLRRNGRNPNRPFLADHSVPSAWTLDPGFTAVYAFAPDGISVDKPRIRQRDGGADGVQATTGTGSAKAALAEGAYRQRGDGQAGA